MDYYCSISVVLLVFDEIIVFVWHRVQGIDGLLLSPFYPTKKIPRLSRIFIDILRCKMNIFYLLIAQLIFPLPSSLLHSKRLLRRQPVCFGI